VRVNAEGRALGTSPHTEQVQEHEGLQVLAQIAWAHQPRDEPMRAAAGAVDDGANVIVH